MDHVRLSHLITILQTIQDTGLAFSLDEWAASDADYDDDGTLCGTVCCAVGYAALDPGFIGDGLHLSVETFSSKGDYIATHRPKDLADFNAIAAGSESINAFPIYQQYCGIDAAAVFFGLFGPQATHLFCANTYPLCARGPSDVIERIEGLMMLDLLYRLGMAQIAAERLLEPA